MLISRSFLKNLSNRRTHEFSAGSHFSAATDKKAETVFLVIHLRNFSLLPFCHFSAAIVLAGSVFFSFFSPPCRHDEGVHSHIPGTDSAKQRVKVKNEDTFHRTHNNTEVNCSTAARPKLNLLCIFCVCLATFLARFLPP